MNALPTRAQIFSLAISAEAKTNPGFSGNDTQDVGIYVACLVLGNVLATQARSQAIFDCPSGGGFIPWLKIQVAKHLCKVPQQHLDSLNVQVREQELWHGCRAEGSTVLLCPQIAQQRFGGGRCDLAQGKTENLASSPSLEWGELFHCQGRPGEMWWGVLLSVMPEVPVLEGGTRVFLLSDARVSPQSVLTVIEVDLKVINSNLDYLVGSLSTILQVSARNVGMGSPILQTPYHLVYSQYDTAATSGVEFVLVWELTPRRRGGQAVGVIISMFILKGDTFLLACVVMLTIPLVGLYDNYKSPQLMQASDRLLDFNVKIMTRIEEVSLPVKSPGAGLTRVGSCAAVTQWIERGWSGFGRVGFLRIYRAAQVHSGSFGVKSRGARARPLSLSRLPPACSNLLERPRRVGTQVLNMVNTRRVLGLDHYLDRKMEEEALAYQDGFGDFDKTTVSHMVVMQMFALFVKVTVKTFGAFQVASGAPHPPVAPHHVQLVAAWGS